MDFDSVAYWELRNLDFGEQAARNDARSRVEQARWRQMQVMDQDASDVAEGLAQVTSRREQIELAQSGITAAASPIAATASGFETHSACPLKR